MPAAWVLQPYQTQMEPSALISVNSAPNLKLHKKHVQRGKRRKIKIISFFNSREKLLHKKPAKKSHHLGSRYEKLSGKIV